MSVILEFLKFICFVVGVVLVILGLLISLCLIHTRVKYGVYINSDLGYVKFIRHNKYIQFTTEEGYTGQYISSINVAMDVDALNQMEIGDGKPGTTFGLTKDKNSVGIGCKDLTYDEANKLIRYLKRCGVDINPLNKPL